MWATGLGQYMQGPDATVFWFCPEPPFSSAAFQPGHNRWAALASSVRPAIRISMCCVQ